MGELFTDLHRIDGLREELIFYLKSTNLPVMETVEFLNTLFQTPVEQTEHKLAEV